MRNISLIASAIQPTTIQVYLSSDGLERMPISVPKKIALVSRSPMFMKPLELIQIIRRHCLRIPNTTDHPHPLRARPVS